MKHTDEMDLLLHIQRDEITAVAIYAKLATIVPDAHNAHILSSIAQDEERHYFTFQKITGQDIPARRVYAWFLVLLARTLGITFALRILEAAEIRVQQNYGVLIERYPELMILLEEEEQHEQELLELLKEERLTYVSSMVLGLNDALVELTGVLAGLTFAFRDTRLIALSGLITGIAASMSMASSEFLANRATGQEKNAKKAALYTGIAYIITVLLLVLPFLVLKNYILALIITMIIALVIIFVYNFYISVAKKLPFRKHFLEMAFLSLGVSALSFFIGILVRKFLGVEV